MSIEIIDLLKPKNGLSFKLIEDIDIAVSGYTSLADAVAHFATTAGMTAAINAATSGKQDTLTESQLTAVNSGITSALVTQIGTNTSAIAGKADAADLTALATTVNGKADASDLAATNATVAGKADASDVATATADLQAQIDAIVTPVTEDAEVQNARVDASGVTHASLKARCDSDSAKTSTISHSLDNSWYISTTTTEERFYNASSGNFANNSSYGYKQANVYPGFRYIYYSNYNESQAGYAFFDERGTALTSGLAVKGTVDVLAPAGASYAVFSYRLNSAPDAVVKAYPTTDVLTNNILLYDEATTATNSLKNIMTVDNTTVINETFYKPDGTSDTNAGYATLQVAVNAGDKYIFNAAKAETVAGYCFYDETGVIANSGALNTGTNQVIIVPNGAIYGYFSYRVSYASKIKLYNVTSIYKITNNLNTLNGGISDLNQWKNSGISPSNLKQRITIDAAGTGVTRIENTRITNYNTETMQLSFVEDTNCYLLKINLNLLKSGALSSADYSEHITGTIRALTVATGTNDREYLSFTAKWSALASTSWLTVDSSGNWETSLDEIISQYPSATCVYIGLEYAYTHPPIYFDGTVILPPWIAVDNSFPKLVLPSTSVAVVGHEWNLYYDNVIEGLNDAFYVKVSSNLNTIKAYDDCIRITPQNADIGTKNVRISIHQKTTGNIVDYATLTLYVLNDATFTGRKIICIGDSLTDSDVYPAEIQYHLSNEGITSLGTIANTATIGGQTYSVNDEGRSGWATYDYTRTVQSYRTDIPNPFWDGEKFNFSYYMTQQGYSSVDAVIIGLGTNGNNHLEDSLEALDIMIDSIHEYNSSLPIILSLVTPPASQDGCGSMQNLQSYYELKQRLLNVNKAYIEKYDNITYPYVHLAELYFNLDCKRDFPTTEQAASSRNPMIVTRQSNNVHPSEYGYLKYADVYYNRLVKALS